MTKKIRLIPIHFFCLALSCILLAGMNPHRASAMEAHRGIQGPFSSTAEVTAACLKCHRQQAIEVLESVHWTWIRQRSVNGKNILFGKKDSLTGFAIDVSSNPTRCMGCHISNSRPDVKFDTPTPEMVDCLVCHDTTGTYRQASPGIANDNSPEEFVLMARNAGKPSVSNCMTCHFSDCGLPETDTSESISPARTTTFSDIHLDPGKGSFTCQDCHTTRNGHSFARSLSRTNGSMADQGCAACHTAAPHTIDQLNQHVSTIACQTCHIPQFARKRPVMIGWNWIMTGKSNRVYMQEQNGRVMAQDENGFSFAPKIEPVYLWDDGGDMIYTRGTRINPQELTYLQRPAAKSSASKITPFRVIYGTQLYDTKYRYLVSPLLQATGSTLFPGSDWEKIAREGMHAIVLPFSGQYTFVPTAAFRRVNHGVVPARDALGCIDCHGTTSPIPWNDLGYDKVPWFSGETETSESAGKTTAVIPIAPTGLQPVKESVKPSTLPF